MCSTGPDTYLTATFLEDAARPAVDTTRLDPRTRVVRLDVESRVVLAVTREDDRGVGAAYVRWLESVHGTAITTRSRPSVQRIGRALET